MERYDPVTKQYRVVPVMVRLEPSLHEVLLKILDEEVEAASSYMRGLLIKELKTRGRLSEDQIAELAGSSR
jgi:hypothetical protein